MMLPLLPMLLLALREVSSFVTLPSARRVSPSTPGQAALLRSWAFQRASCSSSSNPTTLRSVPAVSGVLECSTTDNTTDSILQVWKDELERCHTTRQLDSFEKQLILEAEIYVELADQPDIEKNPSPVIVVDALRLLAVQVFDKRLRLLQSAKRAASGKVDITFQIAGVPLKHPTIGLDQFEQRVDEIFNTWYAKRNECLLTQRKYQGPYFCVIQSNGMGKTKLLHEYKMRKSRSSQASSPPPTIPAATTTSSSSGREARCDDAIKCVLIRCMDFDDRSWNDNGNIFDHKLIPPEVCSDTSNWMKNQLREFVTGGDQRNLLGRSERNFNSTAEKVVLLFDEAQHLLQSGGFWFDEIRQLLCDDRLLLDKYDVVAIFSGSTMTKIYQPTFEGGRFSSFDSDSKKRFYPPFTDLATVGCYANDVGSRAAQSEYERAVYHGRPLFAMMQKTGRLRVNECQFIMRKLLMGHSSYRHNRMSIWSILASRLPMGQVAYTLDRMDLITKGWANTHTVPLVSETHGENRHGTFELQTRYPPDPVCARLAMCLMDESFSCESSYGENKTWWSEKLANLYTLGYGLPTHLDEMEHVMSTLYLLFCGDVLRSQYNRSYVHFSVSLRDWMCRLRHGGNVGDESSSQSDLKSVDNANDGSSAAASISFIQVCRIEASSLDMNDLLNPKSLQQLYESGTAYYDALHPEQVIYMVAAIRFTDKNKATGEASSFAYAPLMIRFQGPYWDDNVVLESLASMKAAVEKAGFTNGLCLVMSMRNSNKSNLPEPSVLDIAQFGCTDAIVSGFLQVPKDNAFGLLRR